MLNFNPPPPIKCKHCGKPKDHHNAYSQMCPRGTRHRTIGYTWYGPTVFTPKDEDLPKRKRIPKEMRHLKLVKD